MEGKEENLFEFEEKRMSEGFFPKVHKVSNNLAKLDHNSASPIYAKNVIKKIFIAIIYS